MNDETRESAERIAKRIENPADQGGITTEMRDGHPWLLIRGPVIGGQQLTIALPDNGRGDGPFDGEN